MRDGFIKVAASTPEIRVADVDHNKKLICEGVDQAWKEGVQLLAYPELCLTGYTCGDLFWQEELLEKARQGLNEIPIPKAFFVLFLRCPEGRRNFTVYQACRQN